LLRLRAFVEWHQIKGREVEVRCPESTAAANYFARMHMADGLPPGTFRGLPTIHESDQGNVLIPVTQLMTPRDVDVFNDALLSIIQEHVTDVAMLEDAISMAIAELCGNAVDHGVNRLGCYVAAQRYEGRRYRRTVIALGDLGIGIPRHMRRRHGAMPDTEVVRLALNEGVTGTDNPNRGNGFYWVMDAARQSHLRMARLQVRSGRAKVLRSMGATGKIRTITREVKNKTGTWITLELGPAESS
jgi:anti-sigma regulatory factor (Ser/Thr protein kinase)